VAQVATGYSSTAVRLSDGTMRAWGANWGSQGAQGSLGTGSTAPYTTAPAVVPGLTDLAQISLGFGFMLALATPHQPRASLVPNLAGLTVDTARQRLASVGLFGLRTSAAPGCDTVAGQNRAAGSIVAIGTVVTLRTDCGT